MTLFLFTYSPFTFKYKKNQNFKEYKAVKILNTQDPALLSEINNKFQKEMDKDGWDQLPLEVRESIMEGLDDFENGNVFTNDQVIQEAKQKYGF